MLVQADGKILLETMLFQSGAVQRLHSDGSPDLSFGNGSFANLAGSPPIFTLSAMALQNDGRIIVGGNASQGIGRILVRLSNCADIIGPIPDVYAVPDGGDVNTIYIGYGPSTLTLVAQATTGTAPFNYSWSTGSQTATTTVNPATPGIHSYSVTVTDSKGCSVVLSKQITVVDVRCGNKNDKVAICHGGKSNCVSSNAVPAQLKNGRKLGDCTPAFVSRGINTETPATSPGTKFLLSVNPNPASNYFIVTVQTKNTTEKIIITVYDVTGKQVLLTNVSPSGSVKIGEELKSGIYFIKAKQGENSSYQKLIKTN